MSSNTIQENYSNVLDYIAKTLSIFKYHVDYSQKLTEDCNSLFQLGKLLRKDYENLFKSTPIMISFDKLMDETPIQTLYNLWPVQTIDNDQNSINQSDDEPIITTILESEITQPYKLLSKRTNKNNRRNKRSFHKVKNEPIEVSQPTTSHQTHKCSVCSKEFKSKSLLTQHMLVHTGELTFECSICKKKFSLAGNLKKHMLVHTGERKFECLTCSKKFTQASSLKKHMLLHSGILPFECSICGKKFSQAGNLKSHMRIHSV